ncbi:spore germination protein KA [Paenibacillus tianmuensis]|uniref:Spore germination protein KA n=2 Tax=Paenibacillus tianmuensis TaxID=624147 RepID=A0A1G4S8K4_9BACL|nr:spore germination protein KA [Paenibacillus tianmuensis]
MQLFFRRNKSMNRSPAPQQNNQQEGGNNASGKGNSPSDGGKPLDSALQNNLEAIRCQFGNSSDLIVRMIDAGPSAAVQCAFVYIRGLVDSQFVFRFIDSFLAEAEKNELVDSIQATTTMDWVLRHIPVTVGDIRVGNQLQTLYSSLLTGQTVLLIDGCREALSVNTSGGEYRSVSEPTSQTVVRGPQEGFTESVHTNIAMIRRKIKNSNVRVESKQIGRVTQTEVCIMYIHGIVTEDILRRVRDRLAQIDIDGILESNYIEEFIQDSKYSVFPTVNNSERPDVIAGALLEGRVAILIDGTPFVLTVPAVFTQFLQAAEDYYHRSDYGLIRMLRYLALVISLLAPSLYIAITTFHQEMIPTTLLISLAGQREGIPFPALIEALMMEVTFELLREAGIRMPRAVGTAISIVGALVLGTAAVDAGLVSPAMVIVVSITAIAGFIFPSFELGISVRVLRFVFMGLGASFGIFGIIVGLVVLVLHMSHLSSFGIPYLSPMAPFRLSDQKDAIVRVPWWQMYTRPDSYHPLNQQRVSKESDPKHAMQHNQGEQTQK